MPTKDPVRRRELAKKWYRKNKVKVLRYHRIVKAAQKAHPTPQKCQIEGCKNLGQRHHPDYSKPTEIEWICGVHHKREKHHGKCKKCGRQTRARGLCMTHYIQHRKNTEPEWRKKYLKHHREYKRKWRAR